MPWETIKEALQQSLPESEYSLWIKPLICQRQDERVIELAGPDRFFCSWVRDRYLDTINSKLREISNGRYQAATLTVASGAARQLESNPAGQLRLPGVARQKTKIRSLHPAYTFDQFMVGQCNALAHTACHAMASGNPAFGNCLFINSSTGLGKSHLSQAVVHCVLQNAPTTMMHYLTAQQFSSEMVNGIRNKTMDRFTEKYLQNCDLLLVEDIHTLVGKNKTQEELNTILDYLIKSGKRVIMTAAVSPNNLDGLDADFRSRMTSGLVTKIEPPDYETRATIIRHKAKVNQLTLDDDLVELMSRRLSGDVRKIESAVIGIKAKSSLQRCQPDANLINEVLDDLIPAPMRLDGKEIRNFIVSEFKVSVEELKSRSRKREVTFPRQVGMYLTRKFTDQSLTDIGQLYNRDHSTVLHAIKVITRDKVKDSSVSKQLDILSRKLNKN